MSYQPEPIQDSKLSSKFTLIEQATSLAATPNGCYVVAGFTSGTIRLYNTMNPHEKEGTIIGHFAAKGLHTSLLLQVIISEDARFCFAGVLRGSAQMFAIDMSFLPTWTTYDRRSDIDVEGMLRVHAHSDAKLKGFGGATRILPNSCKEGDKDHSHLVIKGDDTNSQDAKWAEYLLICGRGIKNIHIWSFKVALNVDGKHDANIAPTWSLIHDIGTNGMTIELIGFCFGGKTAYSRSKNYGLRLWNLETTNHRNSTPAPIQAEEGHAMVDETIRLVEGKARSSSPGPEKEAKLAPVDISSSTDMQSVAGGLFNGFAFGGEYALAVIKLGGTEYSDDSFKSLRTEVELPDIEESDNSSGGGRKRRVVRALAKVLPTEDASEALLICTDGTSFHYANSGDAAGAAGIISRYPNWQSSNDHSAVFKLCSLPGNVALLSADWLDKDREGTLLIRPLYKSSDRPNMVDIKNFWGNSFLPFWPVGERNKSNPATLKVLAPIADVASPRPQSPRSSCETPAANAGGDVGSRGGRKGGRQPAPSTKKAKDTPSIPSLKRSSSSSNSLSKSSKQRELVNATPLLGSNSVQVKSSSSSSTASSMKSTSGKSRRGRLSINGQAVLGSLLDAEAASSSETEEEEMEAEMLNKDSLKAFAGKFTAVMVKKRSHEEVPELSSSVPTAQTHFAKKVKTPYIPMPPPTESETSYSLQPYPLKYISIINRHQGTLKHISQTSSTSLIPEPNTNLDVGTAETSYDRMANTHSQAKPSSLVLSMRAAVSALEAQFQADFDRLKINMTEALARKELSRASVLESLSSNSNGGAAVRSAHVVPPNLPPHPSTLPLALRRKSEKSTKISTKQACGVTSLKASSSFEWGEEILQFVKDFEEASLDLLSRHKLEADSLASTHRMQYALLRLKSPDQATVAIPRAKLCSGFNVSQLVLDQISS